jgi:hypothetical protein
MSDLFDFDIDRIASNVLSKANLYECSLQEAWNEHVHHLLKENTTFEEVENYINSL